MNDFLLSFIDGIVESTSPEAQTFIDEIASLAESISNRMSLLAKLTAELKHDSE